MKVCKLIPYRPRDILGGSLKCQSWHELGLDESWIILYRALLIEHHNRRGSLCQRTNHQEISQSRVRIAFHFTTNLNLLTTSISFIGEETYSKGSSRDYLITSRPTWCVDPLDGTVNYTHLFPMFCVSIAFILDSRPTIGVIYAPFLNQIFSACSGQGAWLNETRRLPLVRNPVPPMPEQAPKGCVFSCEWGKDRKDIEDGNLYRKIESFVNMAGEIGGRGGRGGMVHGVRSLGS
jgi:hypothetical protein